MYKKHRLTVSLSTYEFATATTAFHTPLSVCSTAQPPAAAANQKDVFASQLSILKRDPALDSETKPKLPTPLCYQVLIHQKGLPEQQKRSKK